MDPAIDAEFREDGVAVDGGTPTLFVTSDGNSVTATEDERGITYRGSFSGYPGTLRRKKGRWVLTLEVPVLVRTA